MDILFEHTGMNLITPFHRSARGYGFVITSNSLCNSISQSSATAHHFCKECAAGTVSVHLLAGILKEILTDQHPSFMSHTLKEVYKLGGIKSVRTSGYHPQSDGLVEQLNKT